MGLKELEVFVQRGPAGSKSCYCFESNEPISEVKKTIITREKYGNTGKKNLVLAEQKKIDLTFNGEVMEIGKSLEDYSVKKGDTLSFTINAPLEDSPRLKDK